MRDIFEKLLITPEKMELATFKSIDFFMYNFIFNINNQPTGFALVKLHQGYIKTKIHIMRQRGRRHVKYVDRGTVTQR